MSKRAYARVNGQVIPVTVLGWRTLKRADAAAADQQDSTGAGIWEWVWRIQPKEGQFYGFSSKRDRKAGTKWILKDAATTALGDIQELRLVIYHPDQETMKEIILHETYGTLKNASRDDIQKLITPTIESILSPGCWLRLEHKGSETLDISECTFELGYLNMTSP